MNYKLQQNSIQRLSDNAFIPLDKGNTDYKDYLAWIDAGNTPLPVDIPNPNDVINAQLNALESKPPVSRFPREHMIATDKAIAALMEKLDPTVTATQLLATNSGHQKLLAVDTQARLLRAQLK